ncbi:MarR family transcriptional regulator [Maribellus sp. YY47]|uniref:MarR family winged helix-turn-helix transcriptional regulator n=1 Tax=Maribellus sp. YY47 TaxID=2929486 RepID=UPI002000B2CE|nr:MarR family transcriptional regulator [Maribellus sp. YY47]MCK3684867.1 MarR family transcriptional regulator [Maribellus sp. YY47]
METTDILIKIRKIVRSIDIESKKIQKDYGVSIPQVLCLNYLHQSPGYRSTQGDIRKFLNLNPSTVSGIIDRLERKGYLARLPKLGDKRVVNIVLTSSGDKLLKSIPELLHMQLSEKLKLLKEDELRVVESGLNILIGILDIDTLEASPMLTLEDGLEEIASE